MKWFEKILSEEGNISSAVDFGSKNSGLSFDLLTELYSQARHFILTRPLSFQECNWYLRISVRKTVKMPLYKSVCVGLERLGRVVPVLSRISSGRGPTRATYIMFLENWRMYYLPCRAFIIGWFVSRQLNQTWIDCWVNPVKVPEEQPLVMNNRWKLCTPKISSFCNLKR